MPLSDRFHISFQNDIGDFTLTPSTSAETEYPVTNCQNDQANNKTVFDVTAVTSLDITGSDSSQRSASCFGIHNHNMPSDAGARVRLYESASHAGKLEYDSGYAYGTFDGSSQYCSSSDVAIAAGKLAVYGTVKPDDAVPASSGALINQWSGAGSRVYSAYLHTDGLIYLVLSDDGTNQYVSDSQVAPSFGSGFFTALKIEWNNVTGIVSFYEFNENSAGFDSNIDLADYDYLNDNNLWVLLGTDDSTMTGAVFNSAATVYSQIQGGGGAYWDGQVIRVATYANGAIISDHDFRRWITGTSMTSEPGNTVSFVGTPTVTPVYPSIAHTIPWGSAIAGIDSLGGYFEADGNMKAHYSVWFETVVYRSFRIDIDLPTNNNNQLQIDKLWLGYAFSPQFGPDYGYEATLEDRSAHIRKPGGGMETVEHEAVRKLSLDFSGVSNAQRHTIRNVLDRAKKGGDLLITMDPNDAHSHNYDTTSIYRRLSDAGFIATYYNWNSVQLMLEEN